VQPVIIIIICLHIENKRLSNNVILKWTNLFPANNIGHHLWRMMNQDPHLHNIDEHVGTGGSSMNTLQNINSLAKEKE
jgi:hypothetical protein